MLKIFNLIILNTEQWTGLVLILHKHLSLDNSIKIQSVISVIIPRQRPLWFFLCVWCLSFSMMWVTHHISVVLTTTLDQLQH